MIGRRGGTVSAVRGSFAEARIGALRVGACVRIGPNGGRPGLGARVVALGPGTATLALFAGSDGMRIGDPVAPDSALGAPVAGTALLGRAVDGMGNPLDCGPLPRGLRFPLDAGLVRPADRRPVRETFWTGVRAIDGPLAFGRGARIGLFGAAGCGKSTLLDAVVRGSAADATVVALIGERGREAERWIAGRDPARTVICATSDRSAAERVRAAEFALAQAAALARRGLHVLLVVDSLARVATAAREVAIAAGEPPGRGGYPAGVFALLARLVESCGAFAAGSVTLLATVLSEGPDEHDPVSDACRAALDGHLQLSEALARSGRFPAIDVPRSASRTLGDVASPRHRRAAAALRAAIAELDETRDARRLGVLPPAADDEAAIDAFLAQDAEPSAPAATLNDLIRLTETVSNGRFR